MCSLTVIATIWYYLSMSNTMDAYQFASTQRIKTGYMGGELTEQDARCLLARKDMERKHYQSLLRDWKAMKRFLEEEGR